MKKVFLIAACVALFAACTTKTTNEERFDANDTISCDSTTVDTVSVDTATVVTDTIKK